MKPEELTLTDIVYIVEQLLGNNVSSILTPTGYCDTCDSEECPCAEARAELMAWDYRKKTLGEQKRECQQWIEDRAIFDVIEDLEVEIKDGRYVRF